MVEFKQNFLQICKEYNCHPHGSILRQIENISEGRRVLDLSTCCLSTDTCRVLGKTLAADHAVTRLALNDCMLSAEGLTVILNALNHNTFLKILNLKGNNIRDKGTESLAHLLHHNHSIEIISLEWNALGASPEEFAFFADALAINTGVKELDLKNNQLNHECATLIALALQKNTNLRFLDVRWNHVGLIGGRALLEALLVNRTLCGIELIGNEVPSDLTAAIEIAALHNKERQMLETKVSWQAEMLVTHLQQTEQRKRAEVSLLRDKLNTKDEELREIQKGSEARIFDLQNALKEQKNILDTVSHQLERTKSDLSRIQQRNTDLERLINQSHEDHDELRKQHVAILMKERNERAELEEKLLQQLKALEEKNGRLEQEVDKCKTHEQTLLETIGELKKLASQSENEIKLLKSEFEHKTSLTEKRHQELLRELEELRLKDVARVKEESVNREHLLREQIIKLEAERARLEEELVQANSTILAEKTQQEEALLRQRQKLKAEELKRCRQYEDRLHNLQESKGEQECHIQQQSQTIRDLQSKNGQLSLEVEKMKHLIEQLTHQLDGKDEEQKITIAKMQLELEEQVKKLNQECKAHEIMKKELLSCKEEFNESERKKYELISTRDQEIAAMKEKFRKLEEHIRQMKDDEMERVSTLKVALTNYLNSIQMQRTP